MFVRLWWFALGVATGVWGSIRLLDGVRRARERLTPRWVVRQTGLGLADALDGAAERLGPPRAEPLTIAPRADAR